MDVHFLCLFFSSQLNPDEVTVVIEDDGTVVTDDSFFKKLPAETVLVFLRKVEVCRAAIFVDFQHRNSYAEEIDYMLTL